MPLNRYRFEKSEPQYVIILLSFSLSYEFEKFIGVVCSSLLAFLGVKAKVYGHSLDPICIEVSPFLCMYIRDITVINWLVRL